MKAYLYDVFHRCDSIADWDPNLCALALEATEKVEGKYSIKMTCDDNVVGSMEYTRGTDWSEFEAIVFSVYHPGWTNEKGMLHLHSSLGNWKAWWFDFAADWIEVSIVLDSVPWDSAGVLDLSNITDVTVSAVDAMTPGEVYYFDFFRGKTLDVTSDITYMKIVEEMGEPSYANLDIKGDSLDHFQAGLEMEIYDKDDVLSWTGRILYPEQVLEGTEVVGKLKVIGLNSQFNNIYRKNFTTARDSDYIIKDMIDNGLLRFTYDDEIDNFTLPAKYDLKNKIQKMFLYLSKLERAVIHYLPDGEIFFNKYDNLSKGPQIYQATYNFEDETVGTSGTDIGFVDGATLYDGACEIVSNWQGHKKVLRLQDDATAAEDPFITHNITQATAGTREFWMGGNDVFENLIFYFLEGGTILIYMAITADFIKYRDAAGAWQNIVAIIDDTLYHVKVVWRADNTYDIYIAGVKEVDNVGFYNGNTQTSGISSVRLSMNGDSTAYFYIDAWGDPDNDASYTVGDNLKCWDETTSNIKITSYTPSANRHVTRTLVIGANNDLGQVYYVGKASDADEQKYGINQLQPWRDPEITNYTEAKQLGDNLLAMYSLDTQMIAMLVIGKGHLQVGKTLNMGWASVFSITQGNFLLPKRVWYPIRDINELELTDNVLTRKAFNVKVINKFYDEDAQQSYDFPDVAESTMDGTVMVLRSIAQLRAQAPIVHVVAGAPDANYDVADGVEIGDLYIDTTNTRAYICLSNAAGAADWNLID